MERRVQGSKRTGERIQELLSHLTKGGGMGEVLKLAMRKLIEEALETEVQDALGRGYYEHGEEPSGHRNGQRTARLKTAEGELEYTVPQVRGMDFRSRVRPELPRRTEALEDMAVEMYARGLSTRDIEATFCDEEGHSLLSRTAVSVLTERLWEEYTAFATRDLSEYDVHYLFVDGIAERLHSGQPREAVLCAWAICADGAKVLLHLTPGTKEDLPSCRGFFEDMKRRGLADPLYVVTDGAPGLIRSVEECFPRSDRGRCLAHRMRNLETKVPESDWPEFKARAKAAYNAPSRETAQALREDLVSRYEQSHPTAVRCFEDDFEACTAHLRYPLSHRRYIRTTNLLERLFGEERRRMKVVANAFGERAVLKLMYAALIRGSERWRGIVVSVFERKQLEVIRQELDDAHSRRHAPAAKTAEVASPSKVSSKVRT